MKRNDKILQELFFRKSTYAAKLKKKYPQYKAQNKNSVEQPGIGAIINPDTRGITDTDEAKKRLTGVFGATIGVNSVRNAASRSIKSFPIIISDNVEPETAVMMKRLLEEQYAEYINLLISNQIIDISEYESGAEGNIAIQALDKISGHDFSGKSAARNAIRGEVTADDFFKNISAYNLIRRESADYKTGVPMLDALLEDAVILEPKEVSSLIEYIQAYPEEMQTLNEKTEAEKKARLKAVDRKYMTLGDFMSDSSQTAENVTARNKKFDIIRGKSDAESIKAWKDNVRGSKAALTSAELDFNNVPGRNAAQLRTAQKAIDILKDELAYKESLKPRFDRLTSTDIVVDAEELAQSLESSVGELLLHPDNEVIKRKFELATFLLQSQKIAGMEWVEYVSTRLGLPVSKKTRAELAVKFKIQDVMDPTKGTMGAKDGSDISLTLSRKDVTRIRNNERVISRILPTFLSALLKDIMNATRIGVAGAAVGYGAFSIATATAFTVGTLLTGVGAAAIAGAAVGGKKLLNFIKKHRKISHVAQLRKDKKSAKNKILGWERVESLINLIEGNRINVITAGTSKDPKNEPEDNVNKIQSYGQKVAFDEEEGKLLSSSEVQKLLKNTNKNIETWMKNADISASYKREQEYELTLTEDMIEELELFEEALLEEVLNDREYQAEVLSEAIIQTKIPVELTTTYEYDKKSKAKVRVAPKFGAAATYAYGEVEYDKRELKDRKYNAPLMLTVRFKERYADGTYADNELVAVIGILGVITRVPSEEMAYILSSNSEGRTLKGIFQAAGSDKNLVSDLLGATKLKKDVEKLPQSAEIWQNLEKVGRLAMSNKLAGKRSNNIANAHIIFSQKEVDDVRADTGVDYLRDKKLSGSLMKRYSAMSIMIANDASERMYMYDDPSNISWDIVPYSALKNKDTGDQLTSALTKIGRM